VPHTHGGTDMRVPARITPPNASVIEPGTTART
jgi:hypothetical protein